jgi:hypothetical protein
MSGTGKSSVLAELARRGHPVIDADNDGYLVWADDDWMLDLGSLRTRLEQPGALFVAATAQNQGELYPLFDAVVLLSAPRDVMVDRILTRTTNDFGKGHGELAQILRDLEEVEPLLRESSTHEIVTTIPVAEVADRLEAIAS